jgi:hypothetical protein
MNPDPPIFTGEGDRFPDAPLPYEAGNHSDYRRVCLCGAWMQVCRSRALPVCRSARKEKRPGKNGQRSSIRLTLTEANA